MNTSSSIIARPSWMSRWKHGWIILWRIGIFYFWFGLFSLPTTVIGELLSMVPATYLQPEACGLIVLLAGIVNLPLALYFAASDTGFFRKYGEVPKNI